MKSNTVKNRFRLPTYLLGPLLHRSGHYCRCRCSEDHLLKYCSGLALASSIGAISGTIPWMLTLLCHLWVVVLYALSTIRRHRCGCGPGQSQSEHNRY